MGLIRISYYYHDQELQIQDRMIDDLGNRIDTAQEHVANVNVRMKVSMRWYIFNCVTTGENTFVRYFASHAPECSLLRFSWDDI